MNFNKLISLFFVLVIILNLCSCSQSSTLGDLSSSDDAIIKLTDNYTVQSVATKSADEDFKKMQLEFAIKIFKTSSKDTNVNTLISPLSIEYALLMLANGANGNTKSEIENLFGNGMSVNKLNEYIKYYSSYITNNEYSNINIANSIWFNDKSIEVKPSYLQTNVNYFNSQVFKGAFNNSTVNHINGWVKEQTDGMIEKLYDKTPNAEVILINALSLNVDWQFSFSSVTKPNGTFNALNGKKRNVKMMHDLSNTYLSDNNTTGFIESFKDERLSFVALLPNEGVNINDYINSLTAKKIQNLLDTKHETYIEIYLPKFKYEYDRDIINDLKALGVKTAFNSSADFSGISTKNIWASSVKHKTTIDLNEEGVKASATTSVAVKAGSISKPTIVKLDRPFVYIILDNTTNTPLFIGAVVDIQ